MPSARCTPYGRHHDPATGHQGPRDVRAFSVAARLEYYDRKLWAKGYVVRWYDSAGQLRESQVFGTEAMAEQMRQDFLACGVGATVGLES